MQKNSQQSGVTLIETLMYVVLASTVILLIAMFIGMLTNAEIKNRTIFEVESQGNFVLRTITQSLRNAKNINTPVAGTADTILNLVVSNGSNSPTTFEQVAGVLRMQEGTQTPINLTNSHVVVSNLNFQNLSALNTSGVVRITFTISYLNTIGLNEYDFSKTFYASASLKPN